MEDQLALLLVLVAGVIAGVLGLLAGYSFGMSRAYQKVDLSTQSSLLGQFNSQLAEIKTQFKENEKHRQELEKEREKRTEEKEKRWQEFVTTMQGNLQKSREEIDRIQRLMLGTKKRGMSGEEILKLYLKEPIKAGLIATNVKIGRGEVEFALDLGDGRYIPIDSKVPDVTELSKKLDLSEDPDEQIEIKKKIKKKLLNSIDEVTKYLNQPNSIDRCVLSLPDNIIDLCPEMVEAARKKHVFLVGYSLTYLLSYVLHEDYLRYKSEGDLGQYKKNAEILMAIIDKIHKKTETIDKGLRTIQNANAAISDSTRKAKRID